MKVRIIFAVLVLAFAVGMARAEVFNLHHADTPVFAINSDYSITFYDVSGNKLETIQPSTKAKEALKAWHDQSNTSLNGCNGIGGLYLSSEPTQDNLTTPLKTW